MLLNIPPPIRGIISSYLYELEYTKELGVDVDEYYHTSFRRITISEAVSEGRMELVEHLRLTGGGIDVIPEKVFVNDDVKAFQYLVLLGAYFEKSDIIRHNSVGIYRVCGVEFSYDDISTACFLHRYYFIRILDSKFPTAINQFTGGIKTLIIKDMLNSGVDIGGVSPLDLRNTNNVNIVKDYMNWCSKEDFTYMVGRSLRLYNLDTLKVLTGHEDFVKCHHLFQKIYGKSRVAKFLRGIGINIPDNDDKSSLKDLMSEQKFNVETSGVDVFEYAHQMGIAITNDVFTEAASLHKLDILAYFLSIGLRPQRLMGDFLNDNTFHQVVKVYLEGGVEFPPDFTSKAVSHNLLKTSRVLILAGEPCDLDTLSLFVGLTVRTYMDYDDCEDILCQEKQNYFNDWETNTPIHYTYPVDEEQWDHIYRHHKGCHMNKEGFYSYDMLMKYLPRSLLGDTQLMEVYKDKFPMCEEV